MKKVITLLLFLFTLVSVSMDVFPNPSNGSSHIAINLPHAMNAQIFIYDKIGKRVKQIADQDLQAGTNIFSMDLKSVIYAVQLLGKGIMKT